MLWAKLKPFFLFQVIFLPPLSPLPLLQFFAHDQRSS